MAKCLPQQPTFTEKTDSERVVWESLRASLPDDALLLHSLWFVHGSVESEADLVVVWPGLGLAVIEVKGGRVAREGGEWVTGVKKDRIDPVRQVQDARHELQRYLRDRGLPGLRAIHMVALPNMRYAESPAENELPRDLLTLPVSMA